MCERPLPRLTKSRNAYTYTPYAFDLDLLRRLESGYKLEYVESSKVFTPKRKINHNLDNSVFLNSFNLTIAGSTKGCYGEPSHPHSNVCNPVPLQPYHLVQRISGGTPSKSTLHYVIGRGLNLACRAREPCCHAYSTKTKLNSNI